MDIISISKSKKKKSRKFNKKTTKFFNCIQKQTIPKNYYSEAEKVVHQSIQIDNLHTKRYPAVYQDVPESCQYYIVKKKYAIKQHKLEKNEEYVYNSEGNVRKCKQDFIAPSINAMELDQFNDILKKNCPSEKLKEWNDHCLNPVTVTNNKLFHDKSSTSNVPINQTKENVCIVNNELNCGNGLLFQCSVASLQIEPSKVDDTKKNIFSSLETSKNITKKENYNNLNDILPKLMQHVTVYRMLENLKGEPSYNNCSEDGIYSSLSTCSSSSSTREYYLPAVSSSTDTVHVANVLANRRLVELPKPHEEIILKQRESNQGISRRNFNKNNSNLSPIFQKTSFKNGMLPFNKMGIKEVGFDNLKKGNHQILKMLKDSNDGLIPFFPFANFNSLVIKNKSKVIKNYEQSSIGVQTQDSRIHENDDDSTLYKIIKNKRIKLSKENFIVNTNKKNNRLLSVSLKKKKKKSLNFLPIVTTQTSENVMYNFNKANKAVTKVLSEQLYEYNSNEKEKISLDCTKSSCNLSNISASRKKNKCISEDVLISIKENSNKSGIQKPKSFLYIPNMKSEPSEIPVYLKKYPDTSNDSINSSKPHFFKLKPFFDAGFKDPKISRLILSSKTLAGESDYTVHKAKIQSQFQDSNAEKVATNQIKEKNVMSATISQTPSKSSINKENKLALENKRSCISNRCVLSADSIIYGNNAFQKIREKFSLIKNKIQNSQDNKERQEQGPFNKQRLSSLKHSWEESFEGLNNAKVNLEPKCNNNIANMSAQSQTLLIKEKHASMVSFENEEFSDKKKYLLLLPKELDLSNNQAEHLLKQLSHVDEKERSIDCSSINSKSVGINTMNDEHKLIKANLTTNSSKGLKPSSCKYENNESEKETIDKKCLLEKHTQVNMLLLETCEKHIKDSILNEKPDIKNKEISNSKVAQTATLNDNNQRETTILYEKSKLEATMLNINVQAKASRSNNNVMNEARLLTNTGQAEAIMKNNHGQPVILYNSSGYPITDLNGQVLKNNLGAYLLSSNKYEDVITKQLPVFDCDLMSISSTSFNPTKVPSVKIRYKITDRCGNPVSLFNNLGWPLTNKDGFFLHDNCGKLLVEMDSFNFPFCCSNGSPIYLQNGAMLLSQKFKFIVSKSDPDTKRSLKIEKRYDNEVYSSFNRKDNKINSVKTIQCNKSIDELDESDPKDFKCSYFLKPKKRKPYFKHNLFIHTEVPELMHEFFDSKARPRFSKSRTHGAIPQSPIPIFDREGNRLTDENGFPLKNKYGEYMLLLNKNGFALSDSCGGPIFDSNGKQLWLKDLYHLKKCPFNYLYDRYMLPEHPYIDTSTSSNNQNTHESSDDLVPLLDLNFENDQSSEPIMNYIKENSMKPFDFDVKKVHFIQKKFCRTHRIPVGTNFFNNFSVPIYERQCRQPPPLAAIKDNVLHYQTRSYEDEADCRNLYESSSQQIEDDNVPYSYSEPVYEDNIFNEHDPELNNLEQCDNNFFYCEQRFPQHFEFNREAEVQYYTDDNNYVVYY